MYFPPSVYSMSVYAPVGSSMAVWFMQAKNVSFRIDWMNQDNRFQLCLENFNSKKIIFF